jgi:putative transposase
LSSALLGAEFRGLRGSDPCNVLGRQGSEVNTVHARKHLKRLDTISIVVPVYFITVCVAGRRPLLANSDSFAVLRSEWAAARGRYGWTVGRFVVMPDHVHFFCVCDETEKAKSLSNFVGGFKQWTSKAILPRLGLRAPLWQREFFDHLLRSDESYALKWEYVRDNPVRAGFARSSDDWPYAGEVVPIVR